MRKKILKVLDKNKHLLVAKGISSAEVIDVTADGVVKLKYTGPSGSQTMNDVVTISIIEGKIKQEVPEVKSVNAAWYLPGK